MATKNQQKTQETQVPAAVTEKNELPVVNENPYAKKAETPTTENTTDAFAPVESQQPDIEMQKTQAIDNTSDMSAKVDQLNLEIQPQETQVPAAVTEPIKPVLTDNVPTGSTSTPASSKIQNKFGVVVGVSGMAARLLQNMDKNTKFVK